MAPLAITRAPWSSPAVIVSGQTMTLHTYGICRMVLWSKTRVTGGTFVEGSLGMPADIFISYCTADRDQANLIQQACEAASYKCWIAPRDIAPGTAWADAIIDGIRDARLVVLVHSAAANQSSMVRREIDAAASAHKTILPVRIDATQPQQGMIFYLSSTHWFDAQPSLETHLDRLIGAIGELLRDNSAPSPPTPRFAEFGGQPAIAVLPLRTYTQDDEPLADGLTDDLIAAMSSWRSFPVIARNSAFAYRGQDTDIRRIGRDLGARYIVSGSLRRRDPQVRVTQELADVDSGTTLLAETYQHEHRDHFVLQDELVRAIAAVLAPEVLKVERERAVKREPGSNNAYDLFERGMWHRYRDTREDIAKAEELFRAALAVDPGYARAVTALSLCRNFSAISHWVPDRAAAHAESLALAHQAIALDPRDPHAHFALGVALMNHFDFPQAVLALREAIKLNPSHAYSYANLAQILNYQGRPEDALPLVELALRLNPHDPRRFMWLPYLAASHFLRRDYTACLFACEQALRANPGYPHALRYMLAALGMLNRPTEAAPLVGLLQRVDGNFAGLEAMTRRHFVPEAANHLIEGFRRAGFK